MSKFEDFDPMLDVPETTEHLETIEVNGKSLVKYGNWWVNNNNDIAIIGDCGSIETTNGNIKHK